MAKRRFRSSVPGNSRLLQAYYLFVKNMTVQRRMYFDDLDIDRIRIKIFRIFDGSTFLHHRFTVDHGNVMLFEGDLLEAAQHIEIEQLRDLVEELVFNHVQTQ